MNVIVLLVANKGMTGVRKHPHASVQDPFVCPSVCPSDWDKRNTLAVKDCLEHLYGERSKTKRRGQDSNLRYSFPYTGLANRRFRPLSHLSQGVRQSQVRAARGAGRENGRRHVVYRLEL